MIRRNMKAYIKPNVEVVIVEMQALMDNSIQSVTGTPGLEYNNEEFSNGSGDSRVYDDWD